jgi:hypothetical protein
VSRKTRDEPRSVGLGAYDRVDDPRVLVPRERDPLTGRLTNAGDDRPGKRRRSHDPARQRRVPPLSRGVVLAATVVGVFALAGVALAISSGRDNDTTATPRATSGRDDSGRSSGGGAIDLAGVDACSLIDEATVQRLTGETTPFATQGLSGSKCFWGSTRPGVGAYVELDIFRQPDGLSATRSVLGQECSVAPSSAVGDEAEIVTCPAGGGSPQPKVQLRAFERGAIVTLLVNDASGPVAEGELARVVGSVFSRLSAAS